MTMNPGDVVEVDHGVPQGSEAGFVRPAVVVSARAWLAATPSTVFVVPLSTTRRRYPSHVVVEPDSGNGLATTSYAQVEHLRSLSSSRIIGPAGNVGPAVLAAIREVESLLLGLDAG